VGAVLEEAALDKYTFVRDSYLQKRRAEIFETDPVDIPAESPAAPAPDPAAGQPAPAPAR
jgi:phospholipid-binding lipoprotein MlaA